MVLIAENARGFEEQAHAFGCDKAPLKSDKRTAGGRVRADECIRGLKAVWDNCDSREMKKTSEPMCRGDVHGNATAKESADEG
jgi:hypothetical protein